MRTYPVVMSIPVVAFRIALRVGIMSMDIFELIAVRD
jgi:hypothetical protein